MDGGESGDYASPGTARRDRPGNLRAFYPVRGPRDPDRDLTHYPGRNGKALGQAIELSGKVTDRTGNRSPAPRS